MPRSNRSEDLKRLIAQLRDDRARCFKGRFREFDEALGVSTGYFASGLRGKRPLRMDEVYRAIEILGFQPGEYFDRIQSRRQTFEAMPPWFLQSRRAKDRRNKPIRVCFELTEWVAEVGIDPTGDHLGFELKGYTKLLGLEGADEEEQFGHTLLSILANRRPDSVSRSSAYSLVDALNKMAELSNEHHRYGRALDFLDLGFGLESRIKALDLRAKSFHLSSKSLLGLVFPRDAKWCAVESLMLTLGRGNWHEIQERLRDCFRHESPSDATTCLLQNAADERRASLASVSRDVLDEPLGRPRAFDRLMRGKLRSIFTLERWTTFEAQFVTRGVERRAFRTPFSPPAGSFALRLAVPGHLAGEGIPQPFVEYIESLQTIRVPRSLPADEIPISFPTNSEAEKLAQDLSEDPNITRKDFARHILALAATAHRFRLASNLDGAYKLFVAAFDLEARAPSPRVRTQLYRLSMYLLRDIGAFEEAHIFTVRALNCALLNADAVGTAQALYNLGWLEALSGRLQEAAWLLNGSLRVAELPKTFTVWIHHGLAYVHLKLGNFAESEAALIRAECLEVPGTEGHIAFVHGALALQTGKLNEAQAYFEESKHFFDKHGAVVDRLLWGLYYTEYLLLAGRPLEALKEARSLEELSWADPDKKLVVSALIHLRHIVRQGKLTIASIHLVCDEIERPWRVRMT